MPDNIPITAGTGTTVATDLVDDGAGARHFQINKLAFGADNTATQVSSGNPLPVRLNGVSSGGPTKFSLASAASINATSVKASAGQVYHVSVTNSGTSVAYLKLYDKASAPNPASDVPVWRLMIPAGGGVIDPYVFGMSFATGIAFLISSSAGDTGSGAVGANVVLVNMTYI